MRVVSSQFTKADRAKYMEFPSAVYSMHPYDQVLIDGKLVGVSTWIGYSANEGRMLTLAMIDADHAEPGTEVTLLWGEPDGGTRKPTVEQHVQTEIKAVVSPGALFGSRARRLCRELADASAGLTGARGEQPLPARHGASSSAAVRMSSPAARRSIAASNRTLGIAMLNAPISAPSTITARPMPWMPGVCSPRVRATPVRRMSSISSRRPSAETIVAGVNARRSVSARNRAISASGSAARIALPAEKPCNGVRDPTSTA